MIKCFWFHNRTSLIRLASTLFLSILLGLGSGCQWLTEKTSHSTPVHFIRFDEDLLHFDLNNFDASDAAMLQKYGDIYVFYIEGLMGIGRQSPKTDELYYGKYFPKFLEGEYRSMMDSCRRIIFPKIPKLEEDLGESYAMLQKHFPEKKASKVYSFFISPMGANPQAAFSYGQDTIGINWFNYLGKDFSLYPSVYEGYSYMIAWNQPQYLPRNVMLVEYNLLKEKYPTQDPSDQLIHQMIEEGKKYYYLDMVCSEASDATKIGYSEQQYQWCVDNQVEIWGYFLENKLLYSVETMDVKRYTQEGPTTNGMPSESPGMVGTWIGWQIVRKYADISGKSLREILQTSPKEIMSKSNFKPKK